MALRRQHMPGYQLMLQRLRRVRRKAGLTQAEVARALGTTQAYVSKSESGERRMDPLELNDFARIYGTSVETLLPPSKLPRLAGALAPPAGVAERAVPPNRARSQKPFPRPGPK